MNRSRSLYRPSLSTFTMPSRYNPRGDRGFIRSRCLPVQVQTMPNEAKKIK